MKWRLKQNKHYVFFRDNESYQVEDYKHYFFDKNMDMFKFICSGEFFRHVFHELVISTKQNLNLNF